MNKKLAFRLFAMVFALSGAQSVALAAEDCPDRTQTNEQTNAKFMEEGVVLAEQALEQAKQGQGAEAKETTKLSMLKFKCIVSNRGGAQLQGPKNKIKLGGIKAGKGDLEAAIPLIEEGIARIKKIDLTPEGL